MWAEAIPTLPEDVGLKPESYTDELTKRFDNPALNHRTAQIANDGSQKLPQRIIATALERAEAGGACDHLMLAPAAWIAACEARGQALPAGHFTDPLDGELADIFAKGCHASETVRARVRYGRLCGRSQHRDLLIDQASDIWTGCARSGAAAALEGDFA